jgi:hypothetical protein
MMTMIAGTADVSSQLFDWLLRNICRRYVANEMQFDDCLWPRGESWYHNRRAREARASEGEMNYM